MAIQFIQKGALGTETSPSAITDTTAGKALLRNFGRQAGLLYDRAAHLIKYNGNDAVKTLVSEDGTQTLTNKTLTSPVITGATVAAGSTLAAGVIFSDYKLQAASIAVDNNNAALTTGATLNQATLPAFTWTVVAGASYVFEAFVPITSTANGGAKIGFALTTATLTSIRYHLYASTDTDNTGAVSSTGVTTTTATALGATAALTLLHYRGSMVVNAGGTFGIAGAQNAAHDDDTTFLIGGYARIVRVA